jgi:competence protein CoiA
MFTAEHEGRRVDPQPGGRASCPICTTGVIAKCGKLVTWHWAHDNLKECDPWSEIDTEWHRRWEAEVPVVNREVVIGCHRADIRTDGGVVVELQHSAISVDEITEREEFYGARMIWIFDAVDAYDDERLDLREQSYGWSFRWKHPRKSIGACRRPVLLDLGDEGLLWLKRIHVTSPSGGWGRRVNRSRLVAAMIEDALPVPCKMPGCREVTYVSGLCHSHSRNGMALW